ncbi:MULTISPECIES: hypothetical protein [unclassified Mesorhizobium]|uniref:hypothetical protein n=1 Tax=unclassified Mesorhizobium TaxID=325217 RepID=UPI00333A6387
MDDWNVKRGVQAHNLKRAAAWTAMLKAAARQHSVQPITAKRIKNDKYAKLYGDSSIVLASTHGVKAKTIRGLRDMLGTLFGMAESNGSQPEELFQRFEDYDRAHKRTRNTHRDKARKARQDEAKADAEAYPFISMAGFLENSKT